MPQTPHETPKTESRQAGRSGDDWNQEVVPRLPAQFEQEAKRLKAFERSRQIGSASDLLRGLLANVYTVHSFEHLALWRVLIGLGDVCANDWRKRLRQSGDWLSWLLGELLAASNAVSPGGCAVACGGSCSSMARM